MATSNPIATKINTQAKAEKTAHANTCSVCKKEGLPLYLTRYGFMAQKKASPMDMPPKYIEAKFNQKRWGYGLKRLRLEGFVYVYDELDKKIKAYQKLEDGSFQPFNIGQNVEAAKGIDAACKKFPDKVAKAQLLTIPKANVARTVWICFSGAMWTPTVAKRYLQESYRKQYMTPVQVGGNTCSISTSHTCPIVHLPKVLLENETESLHPQLKEKINKEAAEIIEQSHKIMPMQGLIVGLHDPIGLMLDIREEINHVIEKTDLTEKEKMEATSDILLTSLEQGLKTSFEQQYLADYEKNQANAKKVRENIENAKKRAESQHPTNKVGHIPQYNEGVTRDINIDEYTKKAEKEWQKYSKKIDQSERQKKVSAIQKKQTAFAQTHASELIGFFKVWLQVSEITKIYFKTHFDETQINSGVAYTKETCLAIGNTCAFTQIGTYIEQQLSADAFSENNFLLNATVLHHKNIREEVIKAGHKLKPFIENPGKELPMDALFNVFSDAVSEYTLNNPPQMTSMYTLGQLVATSFGNAMMKMTRMITKHTEINRKFFGFLAVSGLFREKFVMLNVERVPAHKLAEATLGRLIAASAGQNNNHASYLRDNKQNVERAIQYRLRQIRGKTGQAYREINTKILVPKSIFKENITSSDFVNRIHTGKSLDCWSDEWINKMTYQTSKLGRDVKATTIKYLACGGSMLVGMFQAYALTKLLDDVFGNTFMEHEATENQIRLGIGIAALTATVCATFEKAVTIKAPANPGWFLTKAYRMAQIGAKYLGPAAGFAAAFTDFYAASKAFDKGDKTVGWLYVGSGALGIGLTGITVLSGWIGGIACLGWILILGVIGMIGLAIAIAYFKDNALQEWALRCSFGTYVKERYTNLKQLTDQFDTAVRAVQAS